MGEVDMSEIKLLPCPFCGGEAIVYEDEQYNQYMIGCKNCCAIEPMTEWTSKENAIAQWNYRKPMQEILERLEEYGSIWVQYQEIMTKEEIAESVLKQAKEQCIRIVKEVGGME